MRSDHETQGSEAASETGFVLALGADETRRQAWACVGVCGFILVALLASILSGTA